MDINASDVAVRLWTLCCFAVMMWIASSGAAIARTATTSIAPGSASYLATNPTSEQCSGFM